MNLRLVPALLAPLALAVACAAQSPPSQAPSAPEPAAPAAEQAPADEAPAPAASPVVPSSMAGDADQEKKASTLDSLPEAEAELAQASQELDRMFVASSGPRPAAAPSGGSASGAQAEAQTPARAEGGSCDTACKAFGSLRRAADAVCRLAGESDTRCAKGRKLVDSNEKRVASCGC